MAKIVILFVCLFLSYSECFATALDDFYEAQFQCNPNAKQYIGVKNKDDKPSAGYWAIISDFKNTELPQNPKIKYPHRRFLLHYRQRAFLICGRVVIGPKDYEHSIKQDKNFDRDAIILLHLNKDGLGDATDLDYEETHKRGMNKHEDGASSFHVETFTRYIINCASKLEDILDGKTKVDIDKMCAGHPKEDYEKAKMDLDRLMGYWKKEYELKKTNVKNTKPAK